VFFSKTSFNVSSRDRDRMLTSPAVSQRYLHMRAQQSRIPVPKLRLPGVAPATGSMASSSPAAGGFAKTPRSAQPIACSPGLPPRDPRRMETAASSARQSIMFARTEKNLAQKKEPPVLGGKTKPAVPKLRLPLPLSNDPTGLRARLRSARELRRTAADQQVRAEQHSHSRSSSTDDFLSRTAKQLNSIKQELRTTLGSSRAAPTSANGIGSVLPSSRRISLFSRVPCCSGDTLPGTPTTPASRTEDAQGERERGDQEEKVERLCVLKGTGTASAVAEPEEPATKPTTTETKHDTTNELRGPTEPTEPVGDAIPDEGEVEYEYIYPTFASVMCAEADFSTWSPPKGKLANFAKWTPSKGIEFLMRTPTPPPTQAEKIVMPSFEEGKNIDAPSSPEDILENVIFAPRWNPSARPRMGKTDEEEIARIEAAFAGFEAAVRRSAGETSEPSTAASSKEVPGGVAAAGEPLDDVAKTEDEDAARGFVKSGILQDALAMIKYLHEHHQSARAEASGRV